MPLVFFKCCPFLHSAVISVVVFDHQGRVSVVGSANKKECLSTLSSLFDSKTSSSSSSSCEDANGDGDNGAKLLKPFTFNCVHQPTFVTDSENFLVFENFYYVSSALGMGKATTNEKSKEVKESTKEDSKKEEKEKEKEVKKEEEKEVKKEDEKEKEKEARRNLEDGQFPLMTTPLGFKEAADSFCATSWNDVQTSYPKDEQPKDTVIKLCFGASFAFELLTKGTHVYLIYSVHASYPINTPYQHTLLVLLFSDLYCARVKSSLTSPYLLLHLPIFCICAYRPGIE